METRAGRDGSGGGDGVGGEMEAALAGERAAREAAERRVKELEGRVAWLEERVERQAKSLNEMSQAGLWMRSRVRAVAQDPVHGEVFRRSLEEVLGRPGWDAGDAEEVLAELVPPVHNFSWVVPGVLAACGRPETEQAVQFLAGEGVQALLSLEVPPAAPWLEAAGMEGLYIHVPEYGQTPFTRGALREAVGFIERHVAAGRRVAVHCQGGAGRANSAVACYLVSKGATPEEAAETIIRTRPRSVAAANLIGAARRYLEEEG